VRALHSTAVPCSPPDFACVLASVLPHARARLLEISACRRGADSAGPSRRHAVDLLVHAAHRAEEARDDAATAAIEQALGALRRELPAGLDRLLAHLVSGGARDTELAHAILERIAAALPPPGPSLDGTPRLVLVAAIALASRCPSA
jgi:hypothetical protein